MSIHRFPRLQEQYEERVLPNGLTIRVLPKPQFDKLYAILAIRYGSVDTAFTYHGETFRTPAGVAHYLEHKTFDLPEGDATQRFTELGGTPNAFTGYDMTAYYVQTLDHKEDNLRLLLRMVFTPHFTAQSVEKERGIIAEEIKMYEDNPSAQLYERLYAALFPDQPLGVPIAGTLESIANISAETLRLCYDAFYRPANMILCVEGNLELETVVRIAQELSPQGPEEAARSLPAAGETPCVPLTRRSMEVAMPSFAVSVRLPDLKRGDAKTELAAELAMELCAGEASECYRELYEQGRIDASFYVGFEAVRETAMLSFGGDSDDPSAVADAVFAAAERLCQTGIDPEELQRQKESALGRKMRELDSFSGTCNRICGYFFDGITYLDFPQLYEEIDAQDVLRILAALRRERSCMSVIDPNQTEEASL